MNVLTLLFYLNLYACTAHHYVVQTLPLSYCKQNMSCQKITFLTLHACRLHIMHRYSFYFLSKHKSFSRQIFFTFNCIHVLHSIAQVFFLFSSSEYTKWFLLKNRASLESEVMNFIIKTNTLSTRYLLYW